MDMFGSRQWIRLTIWMIIVTTVLPPSLWAQSAGSVGAIAPPSFGAISGGAGTSQPGQPIVTNPSALQPMVPAQAPCPAPVSSTVQPIPLSPQNPTGGMVQQVGSGGAPTPGASPLPTHPGILSPVIQQQAGSPLQAMGLQGQLQPEGGAQLSIEEGFARFFILQGVTGQLKQFGYNFFDVQFSGFPPVMDTPVGPDYVLGPDDSLALHIWNVPDSTFNRSYIAPIERDGTIFIPQVGSIPVAGTSFSQATRLIHARLSGLLKRFEMHLSMARLRTIKVYVVGEVVRPSAYEVSSLATASHALYAACGPSKSGSLRRIQVVRDGKTVSELDFYRFFMQGDRTQDVRLQSGDTILVPPVGPVAAIGGPVKRPAIYELRDRATLADLIELGGGLTPTADRKRCQIFRVEAGQQRVILDVKLGDLLDGNHSLQTGRRSEQSVSVQAPPVQDGDFVRIAAVPTQIENAVSLAGAVRNPGPFEFRPGMRLRDLLTPEQMLVDSYMDLAELVRTDPVTYESTVLPFSPKKLFLGDKNADRELQRLDKVMVSTQVKPPKLVTVTGEVRRSGTYAIEGGERLSSVLKRAGGFTARAFPQGIILVRESVRRSQQTEVEKFVSLQKQRLVAEAAALAAGNPNPQGAAAGGMSPEQAALNMQLQALDQLISRMQPGRVVVQMESLEQLEGNLDDVMLEEGDQIAVPQRPQIVNIVGAVRNPVSVVHHEGLQIDDYIQQAGGTTTYAETKGVYILRVNGSTETAYARLKEIGVGDTIVVPEQIEPKTKALPLWQSIAGIIGSMALTVAGIAVIGR